MIRPYDALNVVLDNIKPLGAENIALSCSLDRICLAPVISNRDVPQKDSSAMDGYAVRKADLGRLPATLKVLGLIAAGEDVSALSVAPGECYKIMTGAHVPKGADTVIEWELTDSGTDKVIINSLSSMGTNIRPAKDDIARGEQVDFTGRRISPFIISRFASIGAFFVDVSRKPRVAVIATGSEIAPHSAYLESEKLLDANSPAVTAMLNKEQADVSFLGVVEDSEEALLAVLERASGFDMVVISGGISTGEFDYMAKIADRAGINWLFHKIYQKPGKPVAFGFLKNGVPIFALPGNPVSCMFCAYFYVIPAIRKMSGLAGAAQTFALATLESDVKRKSGRIQFDRVKLRRVKGRLYARPFSSQNSNLISSMVDSNAFMELDDFEGTVKTGEEVKVYIFNNEF